MINKLKGQFLWRRNLRRERLLRKWGKTIYFKRRSIGDKLELDYMSVTPNDGRWHHMVITVESWVKRETSGENTKIANIALLDNAVEVAGYTLHNLPKPKESEQRRKG